MPTALMIGVNYNDFWIMTPKELSPFIKAFNLKSKYDDRLAWLNGYYVRSAIASSFSKNCKYPETPMSEKPHFDIKEKFLQRMEEINSKFENESR